MNGDFARADIFEKIRSGCSLDAKMARVLVVIL
jgi:hypothetical protein